MLLIPWGKGGGGHIGIGIVEVICKLCESTMNNLLCFAITLHGTLHSFRQVIGTGTATLEAKLAQHLAGLFHEPLFYVLLDMHKSYNSLDRAMYLETLRGYFLGPNL